MNKRNIAMCVILCFVTCGFYGIYWLICMANELNEAAGEPDAPSGVAVFLLGLITCGIYLYYWYYKAGEKVNAAKKLYGMPTDNNNSLLYLILGILRLDIVTYCLIQNELNQLAE